MVYDSDSNETRRMNFLFPRAFEKDAKRLLPQENYDAFLDYLSENPNAGVKIPGTHGLRKIRWAAKGSGKRGGVRIIYYYLSAQVIIFLLAIYAKNEKEALSKHEQNLIGKKLQDMIASLTSPAKGKTNA